MSDSNWHVTRGGLQQVVSVSIDDIRLLNGRKIRTHVLIGGYGNAELWYDKPLGEILAILGQLSDDELKQFIAILTRTIED